METFRDHQVKNTEASLHTLISNREYVNLSDKELQRLINVELGKMRELFEMDGYNLFKEKLELNPINYLTGNILKTYNNQKNAAKSKNVLVIDRDYLLPEYKHDMSTDETISLLEGKYGIKVLLIDSSRANLEGAVKKDFPPIYLL